MQRFLTILLLCAGFAGNAAEDIYAFANSEQEQRFQQYSKNLRCPMCDNQNLEGSNSAISADLRAELARMINEGKSDQQINRFMRDRYGDFVFYRPPVDGNTVWLWLIPLLMAVVAVLVLLRLARRKGRTAATEISAEDRTRAQRLLDQQQAE